MRSIYRDSYWKAGQTSTGYPPLRGDATADVAIIGAGITGLTAAVRLKTAGRRVVVLEAGRVGNGTTGGTSAHLEAMPDEGMMQLIRDFGEDAARLVTQQRLAAIDQIEAWSQQYHFDCDFERIPAYAYTESPDQVDSLEEECDACTRMGLPGMMTRSIPLPFPVAGGFQLGRQGRFHAQKYLQGLAAQVHGGSATIHELTRTRPPESGTPCTIATEHGTVTATDVVAATHSAFFGISQLDLRVAPYQSYMLAVRVADSVPDALYWDDDEPYHYTRLASASDPRLLLIGGSDHKTGQGDAAESFAQLEKYVRRRYQVESIEHRWSAEFFEPDDGLPYVGPMALSRHLYAATGYSGTGLTFGTLAGNLIADQILNRPNPLAEVFSPTRIKAMASAHDFVTENLNVAKRFVADRFKGRKIDGTERMRPGDGLLASVDGEQVALYRDEKMLLHAMSPVCTHAGCIVQWNDAEKTWDCPCHGGRFSATGERIYGPPAEDLGRATLD